MKLLSSRAHGTIDYIADILFLIAPTVFGFSATASAISYLAAGGHFLLSLCTRYELGILKIVPFKVHGAIELGAAIVLAFMPRLAELEGQYGARNFFISSGIALFAVWLTTDYKQTIAAGISEQNEDRTFRRTG